MSWSVIWQDISRADNLFVQVAGMGKYSLQVKCLAYIHNSQHLLKEDRDNK